MAELYPTRARLGAASVAAIVASVTAMWISLVAGDAASGLRLAVPTYAFGSMIAMMHLLFLALPAYLVLRELWPLSWSSAALGGFFVAAIPSGLFMLSLPFNFESLGDTILIEDGRRTAAGWLHLFIGQAKFGLVGVAGGLAFWAVLRPRKRDWCQASIPKYVNLPAFAGCHRLLRRRKRAARCRTAPLC